MKRMIRFKLVLAFVAGLNLSGQSQSISVINSKVDSIFSKYSNNTPGCVIGVIKNGEWILKKSFGSSNLDYTIPLSASSGFYIASVSKQFTAACINILVMQNKIRLDDQVKTYMPELPEYAAGITIQNLLHHTSGLRDYLTLRELGGKSNEDYFNITDGINQLVRQKGLNFKPGEKFSYSNSGYILLAEIVNRVSGTTIRKFADEHIFKPLGMTATFFNDNHNQVIKNRVISYKKGAKGSFLQFVQHFDAVGDGNVISTLDDLFLWDQNFFNKRVGGERFIELMLSVGETNNKQKLKYASGLFVDQYKTFKTISHAGIFLGFRMQMLRFPEQNLSVIFLSNLNSFDPAAEAYRIADLFLPPPSSETAKQNEIKPTNIKSENLKPYVGVFQSPDDPSVAVTISAKSDTLLAQPKWIKTFYSTYPTAKHEFVKETDDEVRYIFTPPSAGLSRQLILKVRNQLFNLIRITPVDIKTVNLSEYEGEYYSEELNTSYIIKKVDGKLTFKAGNWGLVTLEPSEKDTFFGEDEKVTFIRESPSSSVNSFIFSVARASGIQFIKKKTDR